MLVVPPFFPELIRLSKISVCLSQMEISPHGNVCDPVTAYFLFGVKLQDVFTANFSCTSHQPVTFCLNLICCYFFFSSPVFLYAYVKY